MKLHEVVRKIKHHRLGIVSPDQLKKHEDAKEPKHKWVFDGTLGRRARSNMVTTRQKCSICGKTQELSPKGHIVRR